MKKVFKICLVAFVLFLGFNKSVFASRAFNNIPEHKSLWDKLYEEYNNPQKKTIGSSIEPITVYGLSECNPIDDSCEYKYAGLNSNDIKDYLKSVISCSNGENYIGYKVVDTSESRNYKVLYNGEPIDEKTQIVWTEEYSVKCMSSESTSDDFTSVDLNNNSDDDGFQSDGGTVDNSDTGVFTYYLVLAIIAFISYILMILVKKFNVFKKI